MTLAGPTTPAGRPRRPTQQDVARRAGVSVTLVSAVVSGTSKRSTVSASEETQQRIWKAVHELGYVPNVTARRLAGGRTRLISVFTYAATFPTRSEHFHHEFFVGVEEEAELQGYSLALITTSRDSEGRRAIYGDGTNALQIGDGGIILGGGKSYDELIRLTADRFPFVHVGRRDVPGEGISFIAEDNYPATRQAVDHLVGLGHRKIGYLTKSYPNVQTAERQTAFADGAADHGLAENDTPVLATAAADAVDEVRSRGLTAVILETPDDVRLLQAAAEEQGVAVPAQLSLLSLGGWISRTSGPPVGGYRIPQQEIGRRAVRILLDLIADPSRGPIQEFVPLIADLGHTIGPPPGRERTD